MKKSFFIALAIYLVAGALLWQMEWPRHARKEVKQISLASLTIKKPKCQCQKCTCKTHAHTPKQEVKPFKEPPKPRPKISKPKKQKVTKQKLKRLKKRSVKKVVKRVKKYRKVAQKQPKKAVPHPKKAASTPPSPQPQKSVSIHTPTVQNTPQPLTPKPSYQERYIQTYASQIRKAILRHKFYPRIARKTKKQGVVELYFELTPKKELKKLKVTRSSGHAILDRAALKCVKEASGEFPAPKECVKVRVPIEYRLR